MKKQILIMLGVVIVLSSCSRHNCYYAYRNPFPVYMGNEQRMVDVKQGSIIIDLIDRRTKKVIWRGWTEGELNNPEKAISQLPKVIGNIFKKLSA